jgi:hypothetical protein
MIGMLLRVLRAAPLLLALVLTACLDPIVGSSCAPGRTICGDRCVDLTTSADHCGACGKPCAGSCSAGVCMAPDGGLDGDAGASDAGADAPQLGEVGPGDPDGGGAETGGSGRDGGDAGGAAPDGAGPDVVPLVCTPPQIACGSECVSTANDPDHCGSCSNRCLSGLCVSGVCQARNIGHVVLIGHDYVVGRPGMNNLVGNGVFLAMGHPVRVLAYEGAAARSSVNGTNAAVQQVANDTGRSWARTIVSANNVVAELPKHDVLLIYAQEAVNDPTLLGLGALWKDALREFVAKGGTIVLLEGAHAHRGTYQILSAADLFTARGRTDATDQTLSVVNASDALAPRVPRTYRGERSTVTFDTDETGAVVEASGRPVVLHLVF